MLKAISAFQPVWFTACKPVPHFLFLIKSLFLVDALVVLGQGITQVGLERVHVIPIVGLLCSFNEYVLLWLYPNKAATIGDALFL
jgi:hypothetical protein